MNKNDLEMVAKETLRILQKSLHNIGVDYKVIPQENSLPSLEMKGKTEEEKVVFQLHNLFMDVFYQDRKAGRIDQKLMDRNYATAKIYGVVSAKVRILSILLNYDGKDLEDKLTEIAKKTNTNVRMLQREL